VNSPRVLKNYISCFVLLIIFHVYDKIMNTGKYNEGTIGGVGAQEAG